MRIMLVDDDKNGLKALKRVLSLSFNAAVIESFTSPHVACDELHRAAYDVIIADYRMPELDGVSLLAKAKQIQPCSIRLMLSGYCDKESLYGAINIAQVQRFIEKPYEPTVLKSIIEDALTERVEITRIGSLLK